MHFRWSYNASARLADLQREYNLPKNHLICDMSTRWNSTLAMLQRLHTSMSICANMAAELGQGSLFFFPHASGP